MAKSTEIKVGDVVRLNTDRLAGYGYKKGQQVSVTYKSGSSINIQFSNLAQVAATCADVEAGPQTKEEIEKEVAQAQAIVDKGMDKLKWMEETGSKGYDEKEFKIWQILGTIDNKKASKIEKARAIAAIVG